MIFSIIISASAISSIPVKGISLDKSNIAIDLGKTYDLKVSFTPANTSQKLLKFITSNKNVVNVDGKGKLTALKEGNAQISVISASNAKVLAKCNVGVYKPDDGSKLVTVTIYTPELTEMPDDPYTAKLLKDLNVKFVIKNDPDYDWAQLRQYIAANDIPDIFYDVIPDRINDIYNFKSQGVLREWPSDLIAKYPRLQAMIDSSVGTVTRQLSRGMGTDKIYALPQIVSQSRVWKADFSTTGMIYRKDWVKKLGLESLVEKNMTMDEFANLLRNFTVKDPDGNGKNDTYGLVTGFRLTSFMQFWGIRTEEWKYDAKAGIVRPEYLSDKMLAPLKWLQKIYREGLVDPEMISNTSYKMVNQKFGTDKFGVMFCNGDISAIANALGTSASARAYGVSHNMDLSYPAYKDDHIIADTFSTLKPLKPDANSEPTYGPMLEYMGCFLGSGVKDSVKLQRIVKLADAIIFDPGFTTLANWGIKGVHYDVKDGKNYPLVDAATGKTYDTEISTIMKARDVAGAFSSDKDPVFNLTNKTPAIKAIVYKNAADFNAIKKYIDVDYSLTFMDFPFRSQYGLNVSDYESDLGTMIVDKNKDITTAFKEWRDNIMANNEDRFKAAADLGKKMNIIK
jgi:ABC-type glycerol-3-phosphate transport system substrate-binding protein